MRKLTIAFYLTAIISFVLFLFQFRNERIITNNQKAVVIGKDKFPDKSLTYVFACHPLDSEKFNDFITKPDFLLYNKTKVGDTIVTDIPVYSCRNQSYISSDILFFISILSVIFGLGSNFVILLEMTLED
jgi:hypothetical protein